MKITITIQERVFSLATPFEGADHAVVEGLGACPSCDAAAPVKVAGNGRRIESHDTYAADGFALCCKAHIGTIRARTSTIFGIEEDERMLHGRARVY